MQVKVNAAAICCPATMMRQRHCLFSYGALLWSFLLLLSGPSITAATEASKKECIEVKTKAELLTQVQASNVLLVLLNNNDEEDPLQDDQKEYKELCERYQATPVERIKELTIAKLTNHHLGKKLLSRATPTQTETGLFSKMQNFVFRKKSTFQEDDEISFPEYLLIPKSNQSLDKTPILQLAGEPKTADTVSEFLFQQLGMKKVGNFVYSIGTLDYIAASLMKAEDSSWKQKAWAYTSMVVRRLQYPMSGGPTIHGKPLSEYYVKTSFKVLEEGMDYPSKQVKRLERMLEQDGDKITPLQKEEMQQKIYTLQKFSEPVELSRDEVKKLLLSLAMTGILLVSILVVLPMLLLSDYDNESSKEEGGTSTGSDNKKQKTNDNDEKKQEDNDE